MIQRIQSIWFLLASVALFCLFFFPYIHISNPGGTVQSFRVTGVYENVQGQVLQTTAFTGLTIATVIVALLPLFLVILYKNRKKQILFSYLVILLVISYGFWLAQSAKTIIGDVKLEVQNYGIGVLLPSIAIIFIIMAIKGIRNDEKLIKSAERLR